MGLLDDLRDATKPVPKYCKFYRTLLLIENDEERDEFLNGVMERRDNQWAFSNVAVARLLSERYESVSDSSVRAHREGRCSCPS